MPGATLDPAIRKLQPYHTEMLYRALGVKPITPNWKDLKGLKGWRPTHPTPLWVFHSFPLFIFLSITPSKLAANERIPPTSVFIRPPRDPVGSNQNSFGAVQSVRSVRSVHAVHVDSPCSANGFKKKNQNIKIWSLGSVGHCLRCNSRRCCKNSCDDRINRINSTNCIT